MIVCQFCGTKHVDPSKVHKSTGYSFCNVGPTGHSCWSRYITYVERGVWTPYEAKQMKKMKMNA